MRHEFNSLELESFQKMEVTFEGKKLFPEKASLIFKSTRSEQGNKLIVS